ncbi:HlyD family secretion protein [Vibrio splendidus]|uniref:HlyD family secretion protein n=1 Tax=Vibrio splendidus TaxID=29497 RepID=UPI003D0DAE1D
MLLILILLYIALCVVAFKLIGLSINRWTISSFALLGVFIIGGVIVSINYNHPQSTQAAAYYVTTPIVPKVSGNVISTNITPNIPVLKGDILFTIDPEPFKYRLDSLKARLASATKDTDRFKRLAASDLTSERRYEESMWAKKDLTAQVALAQYELNNTVVRAPDNGIITQNFLKVGMKVSPATQGSIVSLIPEQEKYYIALYNQSVVQNIKKGADVDIALDAVPGIVFNGEVQEIIPYLGASQIIASSKLLSSTSEQAKTRDLVAVKVTINDDRYLPYDDFIPNGNNANVAIYSESFVSISIIRKVIIRINSWVNFFV